MTSMPSTVAVAPRTFCFVAGDAGRWNVTSTTAVIGEGLARTKRLDVVTGRGGGDGVWSLRGITSNERYVDRAEKTALVGRQEALGRAAATHAALIPIRKTAAWWALAQDERRAVLEEQSHHIAIGLRYLPAIARRLHHCRDLGPTSRSIS